MPGDIFEEQNNTDFPLTVATGGNRDGTHGKVAEFGRKKK